MLHKLEKEIPTCDENEPKMNIFSSSLKANYKCDEKGNENMREMFSWK